MNSKVEERFWKKVVKTPGCWVWTSCVTDGYGKFWDGYKPISAHIFAYRLLVGEIIPGYDLHHKCNVRRCVNPNHLEQVPHKDHPDNGPDRQRKKTHCKRGHEFTPENTYKNSYGRGRMCKTCRRMKLSIGFRDAKDGAKPL